jgi:hypothetical protein
MKFDIKIFNKKGIFNHDVNLGAPERACSHIAPTSAKNRRYMRLK